VAEDGILPSRYALIEADKAGYPARTHKNVVDSDGTLIIIEQPPLSRGSELTRYLANQEYKPVLVVSKDQGVEHGQSEILQFIKQNAISVLNIAGPRKSGAPTLRNFVYDLLRVLL